MIIFMNFYLIVLVIVDLGFFVFFVLKFFGLEEMLVEVYYKYYFYIGMIVLVFVEIFLMVFVWLIVVLVVEWYIVICYFLKVIVICIVNWVRLIIVGIFIFFFII